MLCNYAFTRCSYTAVVFNLILRLWMIFKILKSSFSSFLFQTADAIFDSKVGISNNFKRGGNYEQLSTQI